MPGSPASGTMVDVTTSVLSPWWSGRRDAGAHGAEATGSTAPTAILNWRSAPERALATELLSAEGDRALVQRAYGVIAARVRPVYAVDDAQPASRTLSRGRGSCSQRLAVLEPAARPAGIATRSRGLLVDGAFCYPRLLRIRFAVPDAVLLAWPELRLDGAWVSASELFGPARSLPTTEGFTEPFLSRWPAGASAPASDMTRRRGPARLRPATCSPCCHGRGE